MNFSWRLILIQHEPQGAAVMAVFFREFSYRLLVEYKIRPEVMFKPGILSAVVAETAATAQTGIRLQAILTTAQLGFV